MQNLWLAWTASDRRIKGRSSDLGSVNPPANSNTDISTRTLVVLLSDNPE